MIDKHLRDVCLAVMYDSSLFEFVFTNNVYTTKVRFSFTIHKMATINGIIDQLMENE